MINTIANLEYVKVSEYVCLPKIGITNYNAYNCNDFYTNVLNGGITDVYNYLIITSTLVPKYQLQCATECEPDTLNLYNLPSTPL
jgi:hypothetical protein